MPRAQIHAHGLHVAQTAVRETNVLADALGDFKIGRVQVDVVGDQEFACAHHHGAGRRVQPRLADVRSAVRIAQHFFAQALELPLANVFEICALRPLRRRFVEINRNAIALPDFASHFFGQRHAVLDGHAFDGNKRHHIGRTHARMRPGMLGQINQLGRFAHAAQRRFGHRLGLAGDGHHAAVMVRVAFTVQQVHARNFAHGRHDGVHFGRVAPFGKIGNAFDESFHGVRGSSGARFRRASWSSCRGSLQNNTGFRGSRPRQTRPGPHICQLRASPRGRAAAASRRD